MGSHMGDSFLPFLFECNREVNRQTRKQANPNVKGAVSSRPVRADPEIGQHKFKREHPLVVPMSRY